MVQKRDRYMVAWTPRVNGNSPGRPRSVVGSQSPRLAGVETSSPGSSDVVTNASRRSGDAPTALARVVDRHRATASSGPVRSPFSPMASSSLLDDDEHVADLHRGADGGADAGDGSLPGGEDLVLHLHRLDGEQPLACSHGISRRDPQVDQPAGD